MSDRELMDLFRFDEEDLAHNQSGMLSPKQRASFKSNDQFATRVLAVIGIACFGGAAFVGRSLIAKPLPFAETADTWVPTIGLLLVGLWMVSGVFKKIDYSVQTAEGKLRLVRSQSSRTGSDGMTTHDTNWDMYVDEVRFGIDEHRFLNLTEGQHFTVYYTKETKRILSLEREPINELEYA
jgi:hypothetical protein